MIEMSFYHKAIQVGVNGWSIVGSKSPLVNQVEMTGPKVSKLVFQVIDDTTPKSPSLWWLNCYGKIKSPLQIIQNLILNAIKNW